MTTQRPTSILRPSRLTLAAALCAAALFARGPALAADPPHHFDVRTRGAPGAIVLGRDATATYIIEKIFENFKYTGYDQSGEWSMFNPVLIHQSPFFDISVVKRLRASGEPDEIFTLFFRIDLSRVKAAQIENGVLHVICVSRCIEAASNGQSSFHDYFWINAIRIANPIDAERVNRAFRHLLQFYPVAPEPFDGPVARGPRR